MQTYRIGVYPGDGIGLEVTDQAERVIDALQEIYKTFQLQRTRLPWGASFYQQTQQVVPEDYLEQLKAFDAILLGAIGWPEVVPDHIALVPLISIRQKFDQYACVRPAKLLPGVRCPLAGRSAGEIDLVVVRENSEGEYLPTGGRVRVGQPEEVALQTAVHTRRGIERILRFGFEQARSRRNKLTMVTKSNALKFGMVLWDDVLAELIPQYPDVQAGKQHVDAAAMNLVRSPDQFDVIVCSNLFGDILTDLAGVIIGGLGLAPSANINPERTFPSLFEPVHGSAPDIAGQGRANPVAMLLSVAMMLDWLALPEPASALRKAVEKTLACGLGTPDLGGRLTTAELTQEILNRLADSEALA